MFAEADGADLGLGKDRLADQRVIHCRRRAAENRVGEGMPLAIGAAIACPERKVINLEADGSGMYTVQSLWTQAREGLNVMTLVWANRAYAILRHELTNVGAANPGRKALDMLSLGNPNLDWVSLAKGMGVEGRRVETIDELVRAFRTGLAVKGPFLIEVVL